MSLESKRDSQRQSNNIISHDIEKSAEVLAALPAQNAPTGSDQPIGHLERCYKGHDLADELSDFHVVRKDITERLNAKPTRISYVSVT